MTAVPSEVLPQDGLAYSIATAWGAVELARRFVADGQAPDTIFKDDKSPVTALDRILDDYTHTRYEFSKAVIQSEERTHRDVAPGTLNLHLDPIDGTLGFDQAYNIYLEARRRALTSREAMAPFVSTAMFSLGALTSPVIHGGYPESKFAVIAAPFLPTGPRVYTADASTKEVHVQTSTDAHTGPVIELSPNTMSNDEVIQRTQYAIGAAAVTMSKRTAIKYGTQIARAGFTVVPNEGAVANGLSVFDPTLPKELGLDLPPHTPIVGSVSGGAHTWDVAGVQVVADCLGGTVTDLRGKPRTYHPEERGAIIGANPAIHKLMKQAILGRP